MYSSKIMCAVLMKKLCNSNVCYSVPKGSKTVNSSKNGRLRHEMKGEPQLEMEYLEVVTFIYHF